MTKKTKLSIVVQGSPLVVHSSPLVEIDKKVFFDLIETAWFYINVKHERKPVIFTTSIYSAFSKAHRSAITKRNASKLSIKRGER